MLNGSLLGPRQQKRQGAQHVEHPTQIPLQIVINVCCGGTLSAALSINFGNLVQAQRAQRIQLVKLQLIQHGICVAYVRGAGTKPGYLGLQGIYLGLDAGNGGGRLQAQLTKLSNPHPSWRYNRSRHFQYWRPKNRKLLRFDEWSSLQCPGQYIGQ